MAASKLMPQAARQQTERPLSKSDGDFDTNPVQQTHLNKHMAEVLGRS
jgi:hypothetical protein